MAVNSDKTIAPHRPPAEIALEHGFYDQSHLNRSFKQTFGITPGQYRKRNFVQENRGVRLIV